MPFRDITSVQKLAGGFSCNLSLIGKIRVYNVSNYWQFIFYSMLLCVCYSCDAKMSPL